MTVALSGGIEVRKDKSSCVVLSQDSLGYSASIEIPNEFFYFYKKCHQDLPRNCTESVDLLGSTVILTVLGLSIRGHRTSPSSSLRSVSPCLRGRGHRLRGLLAALPRATPHVLLHFGQTVDPVSTGGRGRGGEAQDGGVLPKTGGGGALRGAAQGRGESQCPPAGCDGTETPGSCFRKGKQVLRWSAGLGESGERKEGLALLAVGGETATIRAPGPPPPPAWRSHPPGGPGAPRTSHPHCDIWAQAFP